MIENIVVEIALFKLPLVEFPLASFLSVPDENRSESLHENFWGTDSSSVWNGSISSRVNARPIRTYLGTVPFGTVPV